MRERLIPAAEIPELSKTFGYLHWSARIRDFPLHCAQSIPLVTSVEISRSVCHKSESVFIWFAILVQEPSNPLPLLVFQRYPGWPSYLSPALSVNDLWQTNLSHPMPNPTRFKRNLLTHDNTVASCYSPENWDMFCTSIDTGSLLYFSVNKVVLTGRNPRAKWRGI